MSNSASNTDTAINSHPNTTYSPNSIEPKWQQQWEADELYKTVDHVEGISNWYALPMFPYPSGDVHIGHWYAFAPSDAYARFKRMQGWNVLHPIGFDAFGLPAENAAINHNVHPREWTMANIRNMRRQFRSLGASYDWAREISTCDPEYYKWNQKFFIDFIKADLAYRADAYANWCTSCRTTLANEQVKNGVCERCSAEVVKRKLPQWFFAITKYCEELLDMSQIDWPESIKTMQHNWIGRSVGASVKFRVTLPSTGKDLYIETFTTRIDTIFGTTFIAIAPEHPVVGKITSPEHAPQVKDYVARAQMQTDMVRNTADRAKTGVFLGAYATNPANGEAIPIFVADYVLTSYGSGTVMGVPAHDQRDFVFALKYKLPIPVVVAPAGWDGQPLNEAYTKPGTLVNSDQFSGETSEQAKQLIVEYAQSQGWGKASVSYHLRDWLISRQRYWGTPIPVIYCAECGMLPVQEKDLPVLLPERAEFLPTGESPLKLDRSFVETTCHQCGGYAERETDTMDTFMDSSWYHLRYISPHATDQPFYFESVKNWVPVHQYMGGSEHAVMHLLYARFFTKAMRDLGYVDFDEPYARLYNQGMLIRDHKKISKRSNPLNPDPIVEQYGADALRCALMFLGPWDQGGNWTGSGIKGVRRWLNRIWEIALTDKLTSSAPNPSADAELLKLCHTTTKKVATEMQQFKFNTSIAALMEMTNAMSKFANDGKVSKDKWNESVRRLVLHLAPLAPHIAEEVWYLRGGTGSVHNQRVPSWDEALTETDKVTVAVQVNGRLRAKVELDKGVSKEEVVGAAVQLSAVTRHLNSMEIVRKIYIPNRLLNLVT